MFNQILVKGIIKSIISDEKLQELLVLDDEYLQQLQEWVDEQP